MLVDDLVVVTGPNRCSSPTTSPAGSWSRSGSPPIVAASRRRVPRRAPPASEVRRPSTRAAGRRRVRRRRSDHRRGRGRRDPRRRPGARRRRGARPGLVRTALERLLAGPPLSCYGKVGSPRRACRRARAHARRGAAEPTRVYARHLLEIIRATGGALDQPHHRWRPRQQPRPGAAGTHRRSTSTGRPGRRRPSSTWCDVAGRNLAAGSGSDAQHGGRDGVLLPESSVAPRRSSTRPESLLGVWHVGRGPADRRRVTLHGNHPDR